MDSVIDKYLLLTSLLFLLACRTAPTSGHEAGADKAPEQSPEFSSPYLSAPFDVNTRNVGPDVKGDDIDAITARLRSALKRDEFESSREYEKRTAGFLLQLIMETIRLGSYLAL
jgi:hypothetical protein